MMNLDLHALIKTWRLPLIVALLAVLAQAFGLAQTLQYQRGLIAHGELWRLLTGNLVHLGWVHLGRDLLGLFLIWLYFFPYQSERAWLMLMLTAGLAVSLGLFVLSPQIKWYVGLSGMEYGLFCAGALLEWKRSRWLSIVMLVLMWALVSYTVAVGPLPGEDAGLGGPIVSQAHLYGALGGLAFILLQQGLPKLLAAGATD
ncbi:MAG: rhombosortase [Gammaproteobacteria bacterium]|jgi:rhomboid family GlyGly-CTERM serine protease